MEHKKESDARRTPTDRVGYAAMYWSVGWCTLNGNRREVYNAD